MSEPVFQFFIPSSGITLEQIEREVITEVLRAHQWVHTRAAAFLGISVRRFRHKVKTLDIVVPPEFRGAHYYASLAGGWDAYRRLRPTSVRSRPAPVAPVEAADLDDDDNNARLADRRSLTSDFRSEPHSSAKRSGGVADRPFLSCSEPKTGR